MKEVAKAVFQTIKGIERDGGLFFYEITTRNISVTSFQNIFFVIINRSKSKK